MTTKSLCFAVIICVMINASAFSQKYKSPADTIKLNKEYMEVSVAIIDLTDKFERAQNDLANYNNKAEGAVSDAQHTAAESSEQASKVSNGDVGDARKAKRKAKQALKDAKDLRHANSNLNDQQRKINSLSDQLKKKQQRLQELEGMRNEIRNYNLQ